jgi:hypothetical protein
MIAAANTDKFILLEAAPGFNILPGRGCGNLSQTSTWYDNDPKEAPNFQEVRLDIS